MKRRALRGGSTIEFVLGLMILMPLVLGVGAIGINLIRTQQTIQLARDAGHMYGRGVDFSMTPGGQGNVDILSRLGASLGLSNTVNTSDNALVVLTQLTYVDQPTCDAAKAANAANTCSNRFKWVFVQRLNVGNKNMAGSQYGNPRPWSASDPQGVNLDSKGMISLDQYTDRSGAIANFTNANGINPYASTNGNVSGLPSGQRLYVSEAFSTGFGMPPFVRGYPVYSFAFF